MGVLVILTDNFQLKMLGECGAKNSSVFKVSFKQPIAALGKLEHNTLYHHRTLQHQGLGKCGGYQHQNIDKKF